MREEKDKIIAYTVSWTQQMVSSPCSSWIDLEEKSLKKDLYEGDLAEAKVVLDRIMAMRGQ